MKTFFDKWQKVCVFLTRRCNLNCRGCNVPNFRSGYELTTEEWKRVFRILKSYRVGFIVLFGGEPTLRDDLPELIVELNKLNLPHTIITNSVRMMTDDDYFGRILVANPYGVSCSVNELDIIRPDYGDEVKTSYGLQLLQRLKMYGYEGDLVANIAVTHKSLPHLPRMVEFFTKQKIWSILSFFHVCPPHQSTYWWYRGPATPENRDLIVTENDKETLKKVADYFIRYYPRLFLHNSVDYFEAWKTELPYKQNWKCDSFTCPALNPDGCLMACIDRPLTHPISIFDLENPDDETLRKLERSFHTTISDCPGCFWDHMWETHLYAKDAERGKMIFAHKLKGVNG